MRYSLIALFFLSTLILCGCTKNATSPGGGSWGQATAHAPFSGRYGLSGTVYNNNMWVLGGASGPVTTYYGDVWKSSNGSSWTQTSAAGPFGGRYGSQLLAFNGALYLIGGNNSGTLRNDVWTSTDGTTWTQLLAPTTLVSATQFSPREDFGAVVYNNQMWVIGGFANTPVNDVWNSSDGITWSQVLANGAASVNHFSKRWGVAAYVFNNLLWVVGGASGPGSGSVTAVYADVWDSATGTSWTRTTTSPSFGPLYYTQGVAHQGVMRVTGGFLSTGWGSQNGDSTSSDGINWSGINASFPRRFYHLSLEFNNDTWVIGGCDDYCDTTPCAPISYLNDVWYSP